MGYKALILSLCLTIAGCMHRPSRPTQKKIKTLSAMMEVTIHTGDDTKRFKQIVIIGEEGKMRLEALNFFGQPTLLIVRDSNSVTLYNALENKFLREEKGSGVIRRITGIPLSLEEVAHIISQDYLSRDNMHILESRADPVSLSMFSADGVLSRKITYSDYRPAAGRLFPYSISIELPLQDITVHLEVEDIFFNDPLDKDIFILTVPPSAEEYPSAFTER